MHLSIGIKRASQDPAHLINSRRGFPGLSGATEQSARRLAMAAALIAACCPSLARATDIITVGRLRVELERVVNRSLFVPQNIPVLLNTAGDESGRLYLPHQYGEVRSVLNDTWSTFLDLSAETVHNGPRGLLGSAFHPGYNDPLSVGYRKYYTFHTVPIPGTPVPVDFNPVGTDIHHSLVTEWKLCDTGENPSCTPGTIDVGTRREVFRHAHGDDEHSGGMLEFGPDGYLYGVIGVPRTSSDANISTSQIRLQSQDLTSMHGKYFRIDPIDPDVDPFKHGPH